MADDEVTQRAAERGPVSLTDLLADRRPGTGRVRHQESPQESPSASAPGCPDLPPDSAPDAAPDSDGTSQLYVTELLRREGRGDEPLLPARPSWVYRLVAALACFALLFGAVLASTVALSGPRTERAVPSSPVPASISGAEALRADLIDASVGLPAPPPASGSGEPAAASPGGQPATGQPAEQPVPAERSVSNRDEQPPPARAAPPPPPPAPHRQSSEPAVDPVLDTVSAFYQNVAVSPRQAFALLDTSMRGAGYQEFRTGWTDVEQVTVDSIRSDGPNAALVTVSLTRTDGTVLHTMQRVLVTPGDTPRITDARLLSASRS